MTTTARPETLRKAARRIRGDWIPGGPTRVDDTLLAVADWLDADAEMLEIREAANMATNVHRHALAVARAYLGDEAG